MNVKTCRIGLFGGTFDPVHKGHLALALAARKEYHLDKVIFIPCYISPFKKDNPLTSARHRINMLRLALEPHKPYFMISYFELKQKGVSYSYRTVTNFCKIYRPSRLYFIMGSDSSKDLRLWKNVEKILGQVKIIIGRRTNVSSSTIRRRVSQKKSITRLVPEPVKKYIFDHGLYRY